MRVLFFLLGTMCHRSLGYPDERGSLGLTAPRSKWERKRRAEYRSGLKS